MGEGLCFLVSWECEKWRDKADLGVLDRVIGRGVEQQEKQTARLRPDVGPHLQQADDLAVVVDEQELAKTPVLHRVTLEPQIDADVPAKHRQHALTAAQAAAQAPAQTDLLVLARLPHSDVQQRRVDQVLLLARQRGLLPLGEADAPVKHQQHVLARRHVLARQLGLLPLGVETTQRIAGILIKLKVSVPRLELHEVLDRKPLRGKVEGIPPQLNRSFYARCIR